MSDGDGALVGSRLSKRYGHTQALDGVDVVLRPGRVHGLVGHNGAGKSTLLRMLSGAERPDSGSILLDGGSIHLGSPREAIERGVSCVYQELSLVEGLSVAQNIFLGRELYRHGRLALYLMEHESRDYLEEYGLDVEPTARVRDLSVAQRQLVEVITALHRNVRFLLLDEPTTALEATQIEQMLATVRRVADERQVGVLLVDHKIDEVFSVADEVTALRDGRVVLNGEATDIQEEQVVEAIVGSTDLAPSTPAIPTDRGPLSLSPPKDTATSTSLALEVLGLTSPNLGGITLTARAGRVLGVYGLVGSGRTSLLRALYGVEPTTAGSVRLFGRAYVPSGPQAAIEVGIAYLPEERKTDGFVPLFTPVTNTTLPVLRRFTRLGVLQLNQAARVARSVLSDMAVRGSLDGPMQDLSGGNQQKVLFGRVIVQEPRLLLLDEPTKGVDIGAKREIHRIIRSLVAGTEIAAIVVSSEEEEVLELSDDVAVFRQGVCDGTLYSPNELAPGDLRRHALVTAGSRAASNVEPVASAVAR